VLGALAQGIYANTQRRKFRNQAEVDNWLDQIRGSRYKICPALAKILADIKMLTPQRGGPGRKPRFSDFEKRKICSTIGLDITSGMITRDAVNQFAKEKKVGTRTIWRI
jgi:hypothetical protein